MQREERECRTTHSEPAKPVSVWLAESHCKLTAVTVQLHMLQRINSSADELYVVPGALGSTWAGVRQLGLSWDFSHKGRTML